MKWTGSNQDEVQALARQASADTSISVTTQGHINVITREGTMRLNIGDWLIKGVHDELYPCHNAVFVETYEKAE